MQERYISGFLLNDPHLCTERLSYFQSSALRWILCLKFTNKSDEIFENDILYKNSFHPFSF